MSKPLTAMGLMSGTSLDGIDVALLVTDGETITARGPSMTLQYNDNQRRLLKRALADAATLKNRTERPGMLASVEELVTTWHTDAVQQFIEKNSLSNGNIDIIGFHGQTVVHRPELGISVQLGLGPQLAECCSIPVVYDMRANDMRHGGQGAPLVPAYHRALASQLRERPVAVINIGGVANVTWIGADDELLAFDTGPGNALIDDWMKRHTNASRDEGGDTAFRGEPDLATVAQFLGDGFFEMPGPKSLDRDTFAGYTLDGLSVANGAATLVAVTCGAIVKSVNLMPSRPKTWIICGGGRHNKAIMLGLQQLPGKVMTAEQMGLDGDAVEAEAWAFLAVRSFKGLPLTYPGTTGVTHPVTGGILAKY